MNKDSLKNLPATIKDVASYYAPYFRFEEKRVLKKNLELANKFAGQRAFIIATGPSINQQDLKKLAGEFCISVSNFFIHPDFNVIKPAYHLFVPTHAPLTAEQFNIWLKDAETHFPKGQKVLISITDKHIIDSYGLLKKQNVYYYSISRKPLEENSQLDFSNQLPAIQSSPQVATYLALYSGAKEIFLLGCDHDAILNLKVSRHFYGEDKSVLTRVGYNEWQGQGKDLGSECEAYVQLWNIYRRINSYASRRGVGVVNATAGGLLDVFPRANYQSLFNKQKKGKTNGKRR